MQILSSGTAGIVCSVIPELQKLFDKQELDAFCDNINQVFIAAAIRGQSTGSQMWAIYKILCNQDIFTFIACVQSPGATIETANWLRKHKF